jgi:MoxR-like ATPase
VSFVSDILERGARIEAEARFLQDLVAEVERVIIGQRRLVERLIIGLLTDSHVLIEGVPGLAKTLVISTMAKALDLSFHRIQFTPDLLPSDVTGTQIYNPGSGQFTVRQGPVFANLVLADEINRAPAKVQSALLEAMQERQVTIGDETHALPRPFFVMATQNPLEQQGTYPLPEAQLDRFLLKILVDYPAATTSGASSSSARAPRRPRPCGR